MRNFAKSKMPKPKLCIDRKLKGSPKPVIIAFTTTVKGLGSVSIKKAITRVMATFEPFSS